MENMAGVTTIDPDWNRTAGNQTYCVQSNANLQQARVNLSQLKFDSQEYLPDYNKPLTIREFEILHLAPYGMSNPQIADIPSISFHTVKSHFDHIFNKLGVSSRTMAVVWAARHGMFNVTISESDGRHG